MQIPPIFCFLLILSESITATKASDGARGLAQAKFSLFIWGGIGKMTLLKMIGISKSFPGVIANDKVTLEVDQGEILALLGENGAGKTTLMNILYGLYQADQGEIYLNDRKTAFSSP